MKYIIMCGGEYKAFQTPKQLLKVCDEVIVERTIRLLKENGITDIAISTNNPAFDYINVPKLKHKNSFIHEYGEEEAKGWWLDAFFPTNDPTCYIWGDVYFSNEAIKQIVNTETNDIELFASAPPFAYNYPKKWIEPFALKVVDTKHLWTSIQKTKELALEGKTIRSNPIIWELWTVIKDIPLQTNWDEYVYNYTSINDYTSDIDGVLDIKKLENIVDKGGNMKNYKVKALKKFDDYEGKEVNTANKCVARKVNEIFYCTKERYEYLKNHNVVELIEVLPVEEKKEEPKVEVKLNTEIMLNNSVIKKTTKKKNKKLLQN